MIQSYLVYILLIWSQLIELKIGQNQVRINPWSSFCDLHWKLICCNKWHPGTSEMYTSHCRIVDQRMAFMHYFQPQPLSEILTIANLWYATSRAWICTSMSDMALKLPQYFYRLMQELLGCYFQSPYYQG